MMGLLRRAVVTLPLRTVVNHYLSVGGYVLTHGGAVASTMVTDSSDRSSTCAGPRASRWFTYVMGHDGGLVCYGLYTPG